MSYSTKSELTREVCRKLGYFCGYGFIETMKRNNKIYVRATLGKPDEFRVLRSNIRNFNLNNPDCKLTYVGENAEYCNNPSL